MTDDFLNRLVDSVFDAGERLSEWLDEKTEAYKNKADWYYRKSVRRTRLFKKGLKNKWQEKWRPILRYGIYSFIPYILVYGVLLNVVTFYFLSFQIDATSVMAHGIMWYFIKEEIFGEMIPELRPTVKGEVKVRNR